jgi:hypothetical protein
MTEFDGQAQRPAPIEDDLNPQQVIADDVDLATGLHGLSAMISAGRSLEQVLGEVAVFAAKAIPGADDTGVGVTLIKPVGNSMGIQVWAATTRWFGRSISCSTKCCTRGRASAVCKPAERW